MMVDQHVLREHARYMLSTRHIPNTVSDYLWLWWRWYAWGALLWGGALAVAIVSEQIHLILLLIGFCAGWLVDHFRGLPALAQQNEILDHFVDWSKVQTAAEAVNSPTIQD